jgi:hypothetical protein
MSILWAFERMVEAPAAIERRLRDRDAEMRIENGGESGDPPMFQCRVCGWIAPEPVFCLTCLADTMDAVTGATPDH